MSIYTSKKGYQTKNLLPITGTLILEVNYALTKGNRKWNVVSRGVSTKQNFIAQVPEAFSMALLDSFYKAKHFTIGGGYFDTVSYTIKNHFIAYEDFGGRIIYRLERRFNKSFIRGVDKTDGSTRLYAPKKVFTTSQRRSLEKMYSLDVIDAQSRTRRKPR